MRTHYDVLGIPKSADASTIRTAYRKLALLHHPDRSSDPNAANRFAIIAEAYAVLSDPDKRRDYDTQLVLQSEREARASVRAQAAQAYAPSGPGKARTIVATELARLSALFSRGKFIEAESLAHTILESHPREAAPYAVLGDIARARGELNHAANMYAHAVQMEPRNPLYQQRYEELLTRAAPGAAAARGAPNDVAAYATAGVVTVVGSCYMALANERALFPRAGLIDSLTLGALVMLFLMGVCMGASFSVGSVVDRFASVSTTSAGRLSPTVALASVAFVSFWAAAILYAVIGITQKTSYVSVTRLMAATVGTTLVAALAAALSPALAAWQILLWGGNLIYIGALCGWMSADALRRS